MATLEHLYREGTSRLGRTPQPELEAKALLLAATRLSEIQYHLDPRRAVSPKVKKYFMRMVERRRRRVPLAYLTGRKEFWSLSFLVHPGVFIPRPETELLVELVLKRVNRRSPLILDLGTGVGNIAVSLVSELRSARVVAVDVSPKALDNARRNLRHQGFGRVVFLRSYFFSGLARLTPRPCFDFIVSNPPYVSEKEWRGLDRSIRDHEPMRALVPGKTGLEALCRIVRESPAFLLPGGYLILEIGAGQSQGALSLFDKRWYAVQCHKDLNGLPRAVSARLGQEGLHRT